MRGTVLSLVLATLLVAGCRSDRSEPTIPPSGRVAWNPGDVVIVTTDTSMELGLHEDRVVMQMTERVMGEIRTNLDTAGAGSDFGGRIERAVKGAVGSALDRRIEVPLERIRQVRYEDGELNFDYLGRKPRMEFNTININTRSGGEGGGSVRESGNVLGSFHPADARRFAAAVNEAKRPAQ